MENHVNLGLFDTEMADDWHFPDRWDSLLPPEGRRAIPLGISPKNTVEGQSVSITVDDIQAVIDGKKFLYIWGWATYNDVFPATKKHVTRFAVRVFVGGDPHNRDRTSFSYSFFWRYNCSDEECDRQGYPATWVPPSE